MVSPDEERITTSYTFDKAGNRLTVSEGTKSGKVTAKYDEDNRLISAKNEKTGETLRYSYDKDGNLISKSGAGKAYTYAYDMENRLHTVYEGGDLLMAACYDGNDSKVFQMTADLYEESPDTDIPESPEEARAPPEDEQQAPGSVEQPNDKEKNTDKKAKNKDERAIGGAGAVGG
jgi:YD repeat-containing protein